MSWVRISELIVHVINWWHSETPVKCIVCHTEYNPVKMNDDKLKSNPTALTINVCGQGCYINYINNNPHYN